MIQTFIIIFLLTQVYGFESQVKSTVYEHIPQYLPYGIQCPTVTLGGQTNAQFASAETPLKSGHNEMSYYPNKGQSPKVNLIIRIASGSYYQIKISTQNIALERYDRESGTTTLIEEANLEYGDIVVEGWNTVKLILDRKTLTILLGDKKISITLNASVLNWQIVMTRRSSNSKTNYPVHYNECVVQFRCEKYGPSTTTNSQHVYTTMKPTTKKPTTMKPYTWKPYTRKPYTMKSSTMKSTTMSTTAMKTTSMKTTAMKSTTTNHGIYSTTPGNAPYVGGSSTEKPMMRKSNPYVGLIVGLVCGVLIAIVIGIIVYNVIRKKQTAVISEDSPLTPQQDTK